MSLRRPLVAIAAVSSLLLSACGGDDSPTIAQSAPTSTVSSSTPTSSAPSTSTTTAPSTTSSSTSTTPTTEARKPFAVGQCLGPKPAYAQVACTAPHTYEIFTVKNDSRDSGDLVKRAAWNTATCTAEAAKFLGSESFVVSRVNAIPVPSSINPNASSQIVCMAYEFRTSLSGLVTSTSSLKGKLAGDGYYPYRICLKGRASTSDDVQFVPCTDPHSSEAVGGKLNGKPGDAFPGGAKIQSEAVKFCVPKGRAFIGAARGDVIASQNSGGPGPWSRGQMVTGCFVEVTSGTVTKSLKGIGSKPLTSYR